MCDRSILQAGLNWICVLPQKRAVSARAFLKMLFANCEAYLTESIFKIRFKAAGSSDCSACCAD